MDIDAIKQLVLQNKSIEAMEVLNSKLKESPSDLNLLQLRGQLYYKMQKWGDAMNDFAAILEVDPENVEAQSKLEMARNILGYFTHDMFNP